MCSRKGRTRTGSRRTAIVYGAILSAAGCVIFFWRAFASAYPVVELRINNRNFWGGCALSFTMGVGLYGLTYLYPVYLGRVRGLSALQIGETLFLTGVVMFLCAPLAGRLAAKIDARIIIGCGFLAFGTGAWIASDITKDWSFGELIVPQILRGAGMMFSMVAINSVALGALPPQDMKNAAGLFNLTRNLGGAVGLAIINTLMNNRMDLHLARLHERVTWTSERAATWMSTLTSAFASRGSDAETAALKQIAGYVRREALVMALSDVFVFIADAVRPDDLRAALRAEAADDRRGAGRALRRRSGRSRDHDGAPPLTVWESGTRSFCRPPPDQDAACFCRKIFRTASPGRA